MKALLFPGQGAQYLGMGRALFARYPAMVRVASDILGYSIVTLCLDGPRSQLDRTQFTQPALYVVNALAHFQRLDEGAAQADWLAGHSLGEYNALLAAGAFDFETGLRLVQRRGLLMASASDGGMMAVVDVTPDALRMLLDRHGLDTIDISAYNTPRQTVIAGRPADLRAAADLLRAEKIRAVPLSVSAPFHSRYMRPARIALARDLDAVNFRPLATPVIANATARPYDSSRIAQTLGDQLVMPVRWTESIRALLDLGTITFEEIGGTVLTKMVGEITSLHTA